MTVTPTSPTQTRAPAARSGENPTGAYAQAAPIAVIELDRFCIGCGYNLRTMPVVPDERTSIPVVRCPECGRFQPANDTSTALRPWQARMTAVMLVGWMLALVSLVVLLGITEGAISYGTLDELTTHGGYTTTTITGFTTTTTYSSGTRTVELQEPFPYRSLFIGLMLGLSALTAYVTGMLLAVTVPHWRRLAYVGVVIFIPLVAGTIVGINWRVDAPHLFDWALVFVLAHFAAQTAGGIAGAYFGRPFARLSVRILLPPSVRPRLAYLWHADGKPIPRPA